MNATIIRQGELVGRGVMAYETAEAVGIVEYLLVDVKRAQVVGLMCKAAGLLGRKQSLSWSQLVNIGRDCLVIHSEISSEFAAVEDQLAAAQNMVGLEVWTDGGDLIGQVVDLSLDLETGIVQQYLFTLHAPSGSDAPVAAELDDDFDAEEPAVAPVIAYAIAPGAIISAGRKRMMVAEEDAQKSQPYEQPLNLTAKPTAGGTSADWRPEPLEMPADFGDLLQKGQSFAGKMTERVKQQAKRFTDERFADQGRGDSDALPEITEQLQAKTDQVKQQMQQRFTKAKGQLDHQLEDRLGNTPLGRSLSEQLNRFTHPHVSERPDPIDVEAFEVWEEDE